MKRFILLGLFLILINTVIASPRSILMVEIDETITSSTADNIDQALEHARSGNYEALLILLNTPGGSVDAMFKITRAIEQSSTPVICYVYPQGGHAWSAGTFILMSSHVAAMAPYTIIGSAQPVEMQWGGTAQPVNEPKIINALVASIKEKARAHGRNETAAEKFITENLNLNADDALRFGVIEVIALNPRDLLEKVDGMQVETVQGKLMLRTKDAELEKFSPSLRVSVMRILSDPLISGILMLIGIYGIIFGLSSPGIGMEVAGLICLILGLVGIGFDVNIAGLLLILIGIGLLIYEVHIHTFGALAIAGIICIAIGNIFLISRDAQKWYIAAEWYNTAIFTFILITAIIAILFIFIVYKVIQVRMRKPAVKAIPDLGIAIEDIPAGSTGFIMFQGERWQAKSEKEIKKGQKLKVLRKEDYYLIVEPES
ncbi:MAG: nodulation protein NfeD [Methanocellales archaeon]